MAQWILKLDGYFVPRRTLCPLYFNELHGPEEQKKQSISGALIDRRLSTSINPPPVSTTSNGNIWEEHEDEDESARIIPEIEDTVDDKGRQLSQQPFCNKLIKAEVQLQHDNEIRYDKVKKRDLSPDVQTTSSYDKNPMLN